ncbi:amidase family protein [Shinella sp. M31]|uniref:amidase family protein n=1 Tax=Shinella sp. M31 TaxID=3368615 RepID=UPI003B9F1074
MDPRVVKRTLLGENISLADYVETLAAREWLTAAFEATLGPGELVLCPTLPHVAPRLQPLLENEDLFFQMNGQTLRNTLIGNFLNWCCVSLPCGTGTDGMPVGFLVSAPKHNDDRLLAASSALEALLG